MLTLTAEDEKKVVAALLGKLYISPASTEDKIRELYGEVSDAVETNLIADTTGRNALYKIHVSLGKIVNSLDQAKEAGLRRSTASRSVSLAPDEPGIAASRATVGPEDRTMVGTEPRIKEEEEEDDDVVSRVEDDAVSRVDDDAMSRADNENDDSDEGTVVHNTTRAGSVQDGDSLVSELLDDDGDTVMG